jgi:hypothetical protein
VGYELHVRRLVNGDEPEDITEDEWFRFVADATDFEFRDEFSTASPAGERVAVNGSFGCWTGHPTAESVPFRWSHGAVHVSFADDHVVVGALRVADALGATVIGDEGENYVEPLGSEPAWESPTTANPGQTRYRWRQAPAELHRRSRACHSTSMVMRRFSSACFHGSVASAVVEPTV